VSEIKWIKINTDMFDNKKIKQIRKIPGGSDIILFWVMLLTLAGRSNSQGFILLTEALPYTAEMLANEFDIELNTVRMALSVFEKFEMIKMEADIIVINGWIKYQNVEGMKEIKDREQARLRKKRQREKEKMLPAPDKDSLSRDCHCDTSVIVPVNSLTINKELDLDKDIDIDKDNKNIEKEHSSEDSSDSPSVPYQEIVNLYNDKCGSKLPSVKYLSNDRKRSIKTAWNRIKGSKEEKLDTFTNLFIMANNNPFLTGNNDRSWTADFNWLIKEKSMVKVLENGYTSGTRKKPDSTFNNFEHRDYDYGSLESQLLGWDKESCEDIE